MSDLVVGQNFSIELFSQSLPEGLTDREKLLRLEAEMSRYPQLDIPVKHIFSKGIYAREIFIRKGTLLTGKIHRYAHLNIISMGDISVLTEHGVRRITAPCTMVSSAGIKRAGFAHEDTIWTTVHATEETDLEKLEAELIAPSYEAFCDLEIGEDLLCLAKTG